MIFLELSDLIVFVVIVNASVSEKIIAKGYN